MSTRRFLVPLLLSLVLLAALPAAAAAAPNGIDHSALRAARAATAKYLNVANALADGYSNMIVLPDGTVVEIPCEEVEGLGGMGIHYVNFGLMTPGVDELHPEILLYNPTSHGVRLVGLEYFDVAIGWIPPDPNTIGPWFGMELPEGWEWLTPPPVLFGRSMNGPMAPHEEGLMPWHFDLHVWLWQANPAGIFAEFNPNLSCNN